MRDYTPDRWVVIEIKSPNEEPIRKVLAGWYGGFTQGDSWRINSGITEVIEHDDRYEFVGSTGSVYRCYKHAYGMSSLMAGIFEHYSNKLKGEIELVEEYNGR